MALHIFHFIQERIEDSRAKLLTDKKKIPLWSKRMHLGLKAYKVIVYFDIIPKTLFNTIFVYLGINGHTFSYVSK